MKDEDYRIVDEPEQKQPKDIILIVKARKGNANLKPVLLDFVHMGFFKDKQDFEGFVGFEGTDKKQGFKFLCNNYDQNGNIVLQKKYSYSSFQELLQTFFEGNCVQDYDTNCVDAFVYLTTPIGTKDGLLDYPELELGFIGPEDPRYAPKVFVNAYENKHQIVKDVEFCYFNDVCKQINKKRAQKQNMNF